MVLQKLIYGKRLHWSKKNLQVWNRNKDDLMEEIKFYLKISLHCQIGKGRNILSKPQTKHFHVSFEGINSSILNSDSG